MCVPLPFPNDVRDLRVVSLNSNETPKDRVHPAADKPPRPQNRNRVAALVVLAVVTLLLLVDQVSGQSLLDNPSFESGTNNWVARGSGLMLRTNVAQTGLSAVFVAQRTAEWHGLSQSLQDKVHPGVTYFCSAWV